MTTSFTQHVGELTDLSSRLHGQQGVGFEVSTIVG